VIGALVLNHWLTASSGASMLLSFAIAEILSHAGHPLAVANRAPGGVRLDGFLFSICLERGTCRSADGS
jgi:hypothetical protein